MKTLKEFKKAQDIGKKNVGPDTGFKNLANKAAKEYGSKEAGERVAGAVLQKILHKEESELDDSGIIHKDGSKKKSVKDKLTDKVWPVANPAKAPFSEAIDFYNPNNPVPSHYLVVRKDSGEVKPTKYTTRARAANAANRGDIQHGSIVHAVKAVYPEPKQNESIEDLDEISQRLQSKFIKAAEPKATADAIEAEYKGDKGKQDKADRTLKFVKKLELKRMFPDKCHESVNELEAKKQELLHHVSNNVANQEAINRMHEKIHEIGKLGGDTEKEYDNIKNNECIDKGFRNAASLD